MNETVRTERELFDGGPPHRLQGSLGLVKPNEPRMVWRVVLTVLIGWAPLAVLAAAQDLALGGARTRSLLLDFAVYARFLIAAPLLIVAEPVCFSRLGRTVRHFLDAGLVREADRVHFDAAVASTRRLRDTPWAELATVLLAYAVIGALMHYVPSAVIPVWHRSGGSGSLAFSAAGWWHALMSLPLLLVLFFGWLWRLFLWGRFLWCMSRLDLRLIPAHPDHAAGLQFVGYSLRAFSLLGLALGAIGAGMVANRVIHAGASPTAYILFVVALVVCVVVLFSGPLLVFTDKLFYAKWRGTFQYGALALSEGQQFERKWLTRAGSIDASVLEASDFSATTDLYQVVSNVYAMGVIPMDLRNLVFLTLATLLPFAPVALVAVPLDVVLTKLSELLL
jgi:hypothetical protein